MVSPGLLCVLSSTVLQVSTILTLVNQQKTAGSRAQHRKRFELSLQDVPQVTVCGGGNVRDFIYIFICEWYNSLIFSNTTVYF